MNIGARLTEWRRARGLTQAKLAERAKLSASTIAMYETNRRSPDGAAITKLSEALGIPSVLLTGEQATADAPTSPDHPLTPTTIPETMPKPQASPQPLTPTPTVVAPQPIATTHLALTHEEAKIILFLRMNPSSMTFFETYIRSDTRQRDQLTRTWRLINDFQKIPL